MSPNTWVLLNCRVRSTRLWMLSALLIGSSLLSASIARADAPPLSDVIQRLEPKEYLVKIDLHVEAYQSLVEAQIQYEMNLENTPIIFPVVPEGGFHTVDVDRLGAVLLLDDRAVDGDFKLISTNSLETHFARFVIKEFKGKQVDLRLEQYVTCYKARVDEKRAVRIDWPEQWDGEVQSALQPQMYIESTNETIAQLVRRAAGDDPKRFPPYLLAKQLAKAAVQHFQPTGESMSMDRHGKIDGFNVTGAEHAALNGRGTWHDGVCLYVAMCRSAGLPARVVIGLDNEKKGKVTSWAEFYLPTAGWVSVDLRELFASPGMMHQLDRPWKGLGTNNDLDELIPIAHHFHPPAGVYAGGLKGRPMLWGWRPMPEHTPNNQRLRMTHQDAPQRGGQRRPGGGGSGSRGGGG